MWIYYVHSEAIGERDWTLEAVFFKVPSATYVDGSTKCRSLCYVYSLELFSTKKSN